MKRNLYDSVFSVIPIPQFLADIVVSYGERESVDEEERQKLEKITGYLIKRDLVRADSTIFRLPFCDGSNLMNAIEKYGSNTWFVAKIQTNPNFTEEHAKKLYEVNISTYPNLFEKSEDLGYVRSCSLSSFVPEDVIRKYAKSKHIQVRADIAGYEFCPKDLLEELSMDPRLDVRKSVAYNRMTPEYILLRLIDDKNPTVRHIVANRHDKTEAVIRKLAEYDDDYECVRSCVTSLDCPTDVLSMFVNYLHKDLAITMAVRRAVAIHPNLSREDWEKLYESTIPWVVNYAMANKAFCPIEMLAFFDAKAKYAKDAMYYILKRDDLTENVLNMLLRKSARIAAEVVEAQNLPKDTLLKLMKSESIKVREAAIRKVKSFANEAYNDSDIIEMLCKEDPNNKNRLDYCLNLVGSLGPESADVFIDYINGHDLRFMAHFILCYLRNSKRSSSDIWAVYTEYAEVAIDGYRNFAVSMLEAITDRHNLTEELLEAIIYTALYDAKIDNEEFAIANLNGPAFYTKEMLEMCVQYIDETEALEEIMT